MTRRATITTAAKCGFAILKGADYLKVLKKKQAKISEGRAAFLKRVPFFAGQSYNQILKLTSHCTPQPFKRGQFVFRQGAEPTHLYVVVEGDFELIRRRTGPPTLMDPTKVNKY